MTHSLLAVSWAMPPLVYPRAIQVSRALKELSCRGWSIDVIALDARSSGSGERDDAFAACYDGFYRLHPIDLSSAIARDNKWWRRHSLLHGFFPQLDLAGRPWMKLANQRACELIEATAPQALVTFAQPWSDHLIGATLKARFPSLPWIAHFSDPWIDNPYVQDSDQSVLKKWARQEHEVIRSADAVLFVNERTARVVMSKYPAEWGHKVGVVPHGFDADLLAFLPRPQGTSGRLKLVYAGSMFAGLRDPLKLLEAVGILKGMIASELMPTFEFVGSSDARYPTRAKELGIDTITKFGERTSYLKSLQLASEADILIVIDTNTPGNVFFPSKVVDYLMFGKPILALTAHGGGTSEVLEPLGHACVDASDSRLIAVAIARMVQHYSEMRAVVDDRRGLADGYRISNTTNFLETAIVAAIERLRGQSVA